jgi:ParB family transcriptional regulator, chromosome partitioning protein
MPPKQNKVSVGDKLRRDFFFGTSADLPRIVEVHVDKLRPNPDQPRQYFDKESIKELAQSIDEKGLLSPILIKVLPDQDGEYIVVAGERRLRAHRLLGRETIAAIITTGEPDEIALIENIQRADLAPLEEAEAIGRLMERHGYSQNDVAKVLGKSRVSINQLLALNRLPDVIKEDVRRRTPDISKSALTELAQLPSEDDQLVLWEKLQGGATVRALRATKKTGDSRHTLTDHERLLSVGRSFLRNLQRASPENIAANREHYDALIDLEAQLHTAFDAIKRTT